MTSRCSHLDPTAFGMSDIDKYALLLYVVKRGYCFLDEWITYVALIYMYTHNFPPWAIFLTISYGGFAILTAYKNLANLETRLGLKDQWLFYPFIKQRD